MSLPFILLISLVLYIYLSSNSRNKAQSSVRRTRRRVHRQQVKPISDADVVGADGDDDDAPHIETVQEHGGDDEDELDLEPQQKQPPPQRRPSPSPSQRGFPIPSPSQRRPSPSPSQRGFPIPSPSQRQPSPSPSQRGFPVPSPSQRRPSPPLSVTDDFSPPAAATPPPSRGGGIVVERGLPPEEWPDIPTPMPSPYGGYLNGEYPWIGEGYDKLGSFERLHDQLPKHVRENIELIAGPGNGLEDLFSDDNVHGCSIM